MHPNWTPLGLSQLPLLHLGSQQWKPYSVKYVTMDIIYVVSKL